MGITQAVLSYDPNFKELENLMDRMSSSSSSASGSCIHGQMWRLVDIVNYKLHVVIIWIAWGLLHLSYFQEFLSRQMYTLPMCTEQLKDFSWPACTSRSSLTLDKWY